MRVAVVGAGPIGQGYAALLARNGHTPVLFSPRGSRVPADAASLQVETVGLLESTAKVELVHTPAAIASADVVVICVLGNGHRSVIDLISQYVRQDQPVIISSQSSLSALYLSTQLALRGIAPLIVAWATTVTGGPIADGRVQIRLLRRELDVATIPAAGIDQGLTLSRKLFGDIFAPSENLLAISLSNLNPQIHMANALLNFTRIENGETWQNFGCITKGVGRYIEALDQERLAIATAFGVTVRTVYQHYQRSFKDMPVDGSVHAMAQVVESQRKGSSPGPRSSTTRYVTEDVPFGIHCIVELGKITGVPTPLHEAGLTIFNAVYGRDFRLDNDLLPALGLESLGASLLRSHAIHGWQ
jgi:opine dehydrogenase